MKKSLTNTIGDWEHALKKRPLVIGLVVAGLFSLCLFAGLEWAKIQPQISIPSEIALSLGGACVVALLVRFFYKKYALPDDVLQTLKVLEYQKFALDQSAIVGMTDRAGKIIYVNEKFVEISGYSEQELLGQDHRIVNSHFHSKEFFRDMWATIRAGKVWRGEVRNQTKSGSLYWVDTTIVPILGRNNRPEKFLAIRFDITERKAVETALRFSEIRARMMSEKALEAAQAKSEFLANMSHEIRTPMNGVIGATDLLMQSELTEEQRELVEIILFSGRTLLSLLNDVLDLSKIESGKMELEKLPFSLHQRIRDIFKLFRSMAEEKNIEFSREVDASVPEFVRGDATRLGQVLMNLVANAVKFTAKGQVVLRVSKLVGDPSSAVLLFEVKDTGIGIPDSARKSLFQAFAQTDKSISRRYGGTGLGLAISYRLSRLMGGDLWFESQEGVGSTFFVRIPFEIAAGETLAVAQEPEKKPSFSEKGKAEQLLLAEQIPLRVLVAEDNLVNQRVIDRMLRKLGYECTMVENGHQALQTLQENRFDLIFMDVQMPEMDGLEATRRIRETVPSESQPVIIAMTASATSEDAERTLKAGMDAHLVKPVRIHELEAVFRQYETMVDIRRLSHERPPVSVPVHPEQPAAH